MKFIITEELAQKILNYLSTKPFAEVVLLIQELSALVKVEENTVPIATPAENPAPVEPVVASIEGEKVDGVA